MDFPRRANHDGDLLLRNFVNDVAQPTKDIVGGHIRSGLVIDEPKGIGDIPIAKHHRDLLALRPDPVGLIEVLVAMPWLLGRVERAGEDAFVRRQPADPDFRQHRNQLWTDRTLRRPEAHRSTAERGGVEFDGPLQLCLRIFRRMESRGQREIRSGASSEFRIDDERQDRVKERRGGQFDLSPLQ